MKKFLFSMLATIFLTIPSFLSATIVKLVEWKRPNGTRIVLMYDVHI